MSPLLQDRLHLRVTYLAPISALVFWAAAVRRFSHTGFLYRGFKGFRGPRLKPRLSGSWSRHLVLVLPCWIIFSCQFFFSEKWTDVVRHPRKQKADRVLKTAKEKQPKRKETSTQQKVKLLMSFLLESPIQFPKDHRCKILATNNSWNNSAINKVVF